MTSPTTPPTAPPTGDERPGRTLVLVRHGRTAWNADGRAQGQTDVDLDELGHEQAARMAPVVAALGPSVLWCSDLARARDTASYVAKELGVEPTVDRRLREFHLGEREGVRRADWVARWPDERARFEDGDYDVVPGGERRAEVASRMGEVCRAVLDAVGPGETAAAVSHGGAIRTAVASLLGWDTPGASSLRGLDNCGWTRLAERTYGGPLRLVSWNEQA
ncbi:histidine phosphatase family protein [Nocardioides lentus]|uniref:Histidine phosphatase family protein n=1 Tax=Nocardioides lentus TaxID=338077 RepID=A0ABP5B489_9ACTN